ncbi:hypothetical protein BGZ60DRAFT_517423 [Tricladium varicosporioides]|nr:hypothetical protein BGZ60DRAFT_517423 [Hymenoscyphus varicosporioides]
MPRLNPLYCSSCHCPRSLYEFPLQATGYRRATCGSCLERVRKRDQKRVQNIREGLETLEAQSIGQSTGQSIESRRCSSCTQLREPSLFGRFLTCELCRHRNIKSQHRRRPPVQPPPTRAALEDHIQAWQQVAGKKEQGWMGYRAITVDDYTQSITPEAEQELQDRQQRRQKARLARQAEYEIWKQAWTRNQIEKGEPADQEALDRFKAQDKD